MANNLLVIMSDEHQARAMGCAGHQLVKTPNLDSLAARGTRFTNAYTPCPICVPARAAFASGQHVHKIGLWDNAMPYTGEPRGWGHALQDAGVPVQSIGKLHYRNEEDLAGFDVEHIPMHVAGGVGMVWASIRQADQRKKMQVRMLGDYIGPGTSKYTDYDQAVVERTRTWFYDRKASGDNRPWCLYVGLVAPHFPLIVPEEYFDLYTASALPPVKLHPGDGYVRHPWIEQQNDFADSEAGFRNEEERLAAMSAYFGLCSFLDHNVGEILDALQDAGFLDNTTIVYTSDHGDNVGARGLWGKSNFYEESVAVPLIISGPEVAQGTCDTPVSLLDLSATIPAHFGLDFSSDGMPLFQVISGDVQPNRPILSQYHAAGSISGAFMLRRGKWKLIYYVGFEPEFFDLEADPEELCDLASRPEYSEPLADMIVTLRTILDPELVDEQAFVDQAALVENHGGLETAMSLGAAAATPPPKVDRLGD